MSMELGERTKRKVRSVLTTALGMMAIGGLYALLFAGGEAQHILVGVVSGLVVGGLSALVELLLFQTHGRRWRFWVLLVVRSAFYVALITATVVYFVALHLTMTESFSWGEIFSSPRFERFLFEGEFVKIAFYGMIGALVVNFMRQVNVLLGQNALLYFVTARYHNPVEEQRVFMFLDVKSSTRIAETLGHIAYHRFLNDFFHDITPAIVESRGEIYQYVGDEVVVTWPERTGLRDANCIGCYFRARAAIELMRGRYEKEYGIVPSFKVGYHYGPVTVAEMGEVRKQIVFHGDTINTAARIRSECTVLEKDLLLSGPLVSRLNQEDLFTFDSVGRIRLSGKAEPMELFTVREAA
jgi:adenylate cyclase